MGIIFWDAFLGGFMESTLRNCAHFLGEAWNCMFSNQFPQRWRWDFSFFIHRKISPNEVPWVRGPVWISDFLRTFFFSCTTTDPWNPNIKQLKKTQKNSFNNSHHHDPKRLGFFCDGLASMNGIHHVIYRPFSPPPTARHGIHVSLNWWS